MGVASFLSKLFGRSGSPLDEVIPPEIRADPFYDAIRRLSQTPGLRHILEIGSSSGEGSTAAFVEGIRQNPDRPVLHCMEISRVRFENLRGHYRDLPQVRTWNASSVPASALPTPAQVEAFYRSTPTHLNRYPLEQVLSWLEADRAYMETSPIPDGLAHIKAAEGIATFDMVLIDGGEFTGERELEALIGASWILLDDINAYKNYASYRRLEADPAYELVEEDWELRNGYAVFRRV